MGGQEEVRRVGRQAALIGAVAALSLATGLGFQTADAAAYVVPTPPYTSCFNDAESNLATLEASFPEGSQETVAVDSKVTLAGASSQPLYFAVASSVAALADPDVDSGAGLPSVSTPVDGDPVWSFESTKIAATVRTVYWTASFSDAAIPACAGLEPATYTTKARELVIPPPPVAAVGYPAPGEEISVVPTVTGEQPATARAELHGAGLLVGQVRKPRRARGRRLVVVAERPAAGRRVPKGTRISLRLGEKLGHPQV